MKQPGSLRKVVSFVRHDITPLQIRVEKLGKQKLLGTNFNVN